MAGSSRNSSKAVVAAAGEDNRCCPHPCCGLSFFCWQLFALCAAIYYVAGMARGAGAECRQSHVAF